jgi:fibronectin type 3 domain-containing protein
VEWPPIPTAVTPPATVAAQTVTQTFDAQQWAGKDVIVGVRLSSPTGRLGAMSNLVAISVIPPLTVPAGFTGESRADGIFLRWTAATQAGTQYRISRQIGDGAPQTIADLPETQYLDLVTAFGPTYHYTIQSYVRAGDINAISEPSALYDVIHIDKFAPAVPTGLAVLAGAKSIELGWDRNTDADLAGYRVYRAVGDGPFVRIPGEIEPPAFRDMQVQTGRRYRYVVTAVDKLGNESARSEPAEAEAP